MARARVPIIATIIGEGRLRRRARARRRQPRARARVRDATASSRPRAARRSCGRTARKADEAAARLKITAPDLLRLGIVDRVIEEPAGGAHQDHDEAARHVEAAIADALAELDAIAPGRARRGPLPPLPLHGFDRRLGGSEREGEPPGRQRNARAAKRGNSPEKNLLSWRPWRSFWRPGGLSPGLPSRRPMRFLVTM